MNDYLDIALKASGASGVILTRHFRKGVKFERKADGSPVSIADREAEKKISSIIKAAFPEHNILGEEFTYKQTGSEFKWIIDPLDMTKNFIRGIPFYSTLIALEQNGRIITGVINLPELNISACASLGKGAFVKGKRARVSKVNKLEDAFIAHGDIDRKATYPYTERILTLIGSCRCNRGYGDALGYVLLAQGKIDVLLDRGKPWDVAAGKIVVEEAGGKFSDFNGVDSIYSTPNVATNGILHDDVIKILKK